MQWLFISNLVTFVVFSAKQLIRALLKTEPTQRMTITEFMNHPWINVRANSSLRLLYFIRRVDLMRVCVYP